jgi:glucosamine--fructose-6-phosphate aminotransferase (isomerizing)
MCGIIGYISKQNCDIGKILLLGLKRLTYRGYDSYGFALKNDKELRVIKDVGDVENIQDLSFYGNIGIGHVRWATHGGVTKINAHPHTCCEDKIAIVHNGIIENHKQLKIELEKAGHRFKSDTDTEIIAHLIEEYLKKLPFEDAVKKALTQLEGSFALVIIHKDYNVLIGAKRDSPLILGIDNNGCFLASDVSAFIEHTNKVIYLDDDEVVIIQPD